MRMFLGNSKNVALKITRNLNRQFSDHVYKANVEVDRVKQTITISPPAGFEVRASLVFMHGLGDTCFGWGTAMVEIAEKIEGLRVILPTAADRPVTLNGGFSMPAWYDIKGLSDRADQDCDGIEASRKLISEILNKEKEQHKLSSKNLILGGFSQGGAMSLYTGLQYETSLGAVICMSGYLPNASKFKASPSAHQTPFCMMHGTIDQVVRIQWARKSYERIMADFSGSRTDDKTSRLFKEYEGLEHSANEDELEEVINFLITNVEGLRKK